MKKFGFILLIIVAFNLNVYSATSGSASPSANVGQLINISVSGADSLGDIRVTTYTDMHVMTIVVDNNDDDGYTLTFQSENGTTYGTGDNFGYLIHDSALDDTSVTPNEGQKPATRYELLLGESDGTVEYGHASQPTGLVDDCESPSDSSGKFEITSAGGTNLIFNEVTRATRSGEFYLCLSQISDIQLFHGDFFDTIVVSIADN